MSRKKSAPKKLNVVDPKYKSVIIPKLINLETISDLNFGSGYTFLTGAFLFLDIDYFGFFAP